MDEYLGDGVYASMSGNMVTLDLRQQNEYIIYLEPPVIEKLIQYVKKNGVISEERLASVIKE